MLGHGEEDCPTRYEDCFVEPECGFPYGSWMRASDENRRSTGTLWTPQRPVVSGKSPLTVPVHGKTGADIFSLGASAERRNENWNPNVNSGGSEGRIQARRLEQSDKSEQSGESQTGGARRRIRIPLNKRKAKEVSTEEISKAGKKPQLRLQDEEISLMAETAEQSRRDQ